MYLSKRAWDSPFKFLPTHDKPPPGYTEIREEKEWTKNPPPKVENAPPHVPITDQETWILQKAIGKDLNQFAKYIENELPDTGEIISSWFIPLLSDSGVSASKAIRALSGFIHKSIYNLENTKIPNLTPDQRKVNSNQKSNLQLAQKVVEELYERLVQMSRNTTNTFQYDSQPEFSKPAMKITREEAVLIHNMCEEAGLKNIVQHSYGYGPSEASSYSIPDTIIDEHGREVRINKYIEKLSKKFKNLSFIDSLKDRFDNHTFSITLTDEEYKKLEKLVHKANMNGIYVQDIEQVIFPQTMRKLIDMDQKLKEMNISPPYLETLQQRLSAAPKPIKWNLFVSAEPQDVLTMSTNRGWVSCVTKGQCNYKSLDSAVSNFDMVAYAISPEHEGWQARAWLRYDGSKWWPESKIYKTGLLDDGDFLNAVIKYLKDKDIYGVPGQYDENAFGWSDMLGGFIDEQEDREEPEYEYLPFQEREHLYEDEVQTGKVRSKLPATTKRIMLAIPFENSYKNLPKGIGIKHMGLATSFLNTDFNIFFDVPEQYLHMGKQLFHKTIVDIRVNMDWGNYNGKEFSIYYDIMSKLRQLNIKPIFTKKFNSVLDLAIHEAEWKNLNDYLESMLANGITNFYDNKHDSLCAFDNTCFLYWSKPRLI